MWSDEITMRDMSTSRLVCGKRSFRNLRDLWSVSCLWICCECRSCFVVRCLVWESPIYERNGTCIFSQGTYQLKRRRLFCEARRKRLVWVSRCRYWYGWHLTIGLRGGVHGGREHLRGWEGRVCFTLFHLVCKFSWLICLARALAVCGCCLFLVGFVPCWFLSSGEIWFQSHANSSCWPTMSRTCPAMQEKKIDPVV